DLIRFCPKPNVALFEGFIAKVENIPIVVKHLHVTSANYDTQCVPLLHIDDLVMALQHFPHAFDDSVDPNVLLQWIGPGQIVVTVVACSPNEAASHVRFARDREE